jgi:hypothetical protein
MVFLNVSLRSFFVILIFLGSFLLAHGIINRFAEGGFWEEILLGLFLSILAILLAAIPIRAIEGSEANKN